MKPAHVGFYVHYHGLGHKHRTEAILRHLELPATVITSRASGAQWHGPTLQQVVDLPCDNDDVNDRGLAVAGTVPALHFAPLWCSNITDRVAKYAQWLATTEPDLLVVDVSAEISLLTRLASIPQVVVRQHGDRRDAGHMNAYQAACHLLAPFPELLEDDITPDEIRKKTVYLDGFYKFNKTPSEKISVQFEQPTIVALFGRGGSDEPIRQLYHAARAIPQYQWLIVGKTAPSGEMEPPGNLHFQGWVADTSSYIQAADIILTAAGHNSIMEVGGARKRIIAIAEPRPFDEQLRKVHVLNRQQLAVGLTQWPSERAWPQVLEAALELDPKKWDVVFKDDGARQAAEHLQRWALESYDNRHNAKRVCL